MRSPYISQMIEISPISISGLLILKYNAAIDQPESQSNFEFREWDFHAIFYCYIHALFYLLHEHT